MRPGEQTVQVFGKVDNEDRAGQITEVRAGASRAQLVCFRKSRSLFAQPALHGACREITNKRMRQATSNAFFVASTFFDVRSPPPLRLHARSASAARHYLSVMSHLHDPARKPGGPSQNR